VLARIAYNRFRHCHFYYYSTAFVTFSCSASGAAVAAAAQIGSGSRIYQSVTVFPKQVADINDKPLYKPSGGSSDRGQIKGKLVYALPIKTANNAKYSTNCTMSNTPQKSSFARTAVAEGERARALFIRKS
jgi:hypothetical protein